MICKEIDSRETVEVICHYFLSTLAVKGKRGHR